MYYKKEVDKMKAVILAIGNEVVSGDIVNTNAAYIADYIKSFGVDTIAHAAVTDKEKHIIKALKSSFKKADIIITTGGLGPTYDDITKKAAAKYFKRELVKDEESESKIREYFEKLERPMSDVNMVQCYFPKGSEIIPNSNGTAPGAIIRDAKKTVLMFPGPPSEMSLMLKSSPVTAFLSSVKDEEIMETIVRFFGIGESALQEMLSDYLSASKNVTVAPYIKTGEVELKITVKAQTAEEAQSKTDEIKEILKEKAGQYIYSEENEELEEVVIKKLKEKGLKLVTVESCTGGLIGKKITDVSGSSEVYSGGLITYSNEMKMMLCGVKEETLDNYGAVSKGTALEMAEGALRRYGADIAVSVTGVAGPGCSENKSAGLVYIGTATRNGSDAKRFSFGGNREKVREQSAKNALYAVLKLLNEE